MGQGSGLAEGIAHCGQNDVPQCQIDFRVSLKPTVLEAIATGNPPYRRSQQELAAFMARIEGLPAGLEERIASTFRRSGIEHRYSCLEDFGQEEADHFNFFPNNWQLSPLPSTAKRNDLYSRLALPLAETVARDALAQAGCSAEQITHLIVVSCTGFFAPGLDIQLIQRLGIPPSAERSLIGFMGCNAAFNGLKLTDAICRASPASTRVLMVCVELCTLHMQRPDNVENVIVNALFGDGAAAAVLSCRDPKRGQLTYRDSACTIAEHSLEAMTWEIGDTGFLMQLAASVPQRIQHALPGFLEPWLQRHGLDASGIDLWAVHPGGRQILDLVQQGQALPTQALEASYGVLRDFGNMSSPTILFILKHWMALPPQNPAAAPRQGVALGFGPGLSIEAALFQHCDSESR